MPDTILLATSMPPDLFSVGALALKDKTEIA